LSNTPVRDGSAPESIAARDGWHSGEAQYALSNTTDSAASASRCGARTTRCP
jgi:hypothetical protein